MVPNGGPATVKFPQLWDDGRRWWTGRHERSPFLLQSSQLPLALPLFHPLNRFPCDGSQCPNRIHIFGYTNRLNQNLYCSCLDGVGGLGFRVKGKPKTQIPVYKRCWLNDLPTS